MVNYMKNLIKKQLMNYKKIKILLNTDKFKAIFLASILAVFFSSYELNSDIVSLSYEGTILSLFSGHLFQLFLFCILFVSSIYTISYFDKSYQNIIRYKNKKEYLNNLLKNVSIVNFIIYLYYIIIGLIIVTFKCFGNISFSFIEYYKIPFILYNCYSFIKYYIIINILILISICLYKCLNKFIGGGILSLIIILNGCWQYSSNVIATFSDFHLFYGYYLYPFQYSSFIFEICCFSLEIIILLLILEIIKYINLKYKKIYVLE